ncbi:MAG: PQQ-binding-like beta-propeller repeat protein [Planctomycetota bacterium]
MTWPTSGPKVVWRRPVGSGYSGPVVARDRLLLFHQPNADELLECLDVETGKPIWSLGYPCDYQGGYGTGPGPRATPSIVGDRAFTYGAAGVLQAVSLENGKLLWRRELAKDYQIPENFFGIGSSPLVADGRVYVNVGAPEGAGLAAFDANTGKTLWTQTNDTASYSSPVAATMQGKPFVFFFARSGLHGVDPNTGNERFFFPWRARINASVNAATPIVVGDSVFITSSYGTGAALLNIKPDGSAEKAWTSQKVMSSQYNTPVFKDNVLFGIDGREDGDVARLVCVEWKTGKQLWRREGFGCASLMLVANQLLMLTHKGELVLADADPKAYRERARATLLAGPSRPQPAFADGQLYARDEQELVRVDLRGP